MSIKLCAGNPYQRLFSKNQGIPLLLKEILETMRKHLHKQHFFQYKIALLLDIYQLKVVYRGLLQKGIEIHGKKLKLKYTHAESGTV
jgi:hypothetical protein